MGLSPNVSNCVTDFDVNSSEELMKIGAHARAHIQFNNNIKEN